MESRSRRSTLKPFTLAFLLAVGLVPQGAAAQLGVPRPSDERPALPPFEAPEEREERLRLPPIPPPRPGVPSGPRVPVRGFAFEGNTVFTDAELAAVTAPFAGRSLASVELREARDAVTRHYVEAGYVSSGATLPDQPLRDGVVVLRVLEGVLSEVRVENTHHFRESFIASRLRVGAGTPLNVHGLERAIRLLQQDPALRRLDAELRPGAAVGEAVLLVRVEERSPYHLALDFDDYQPPTVGELQGRIRGTHQNVFGFADRLNLALNVTEGLLEFQGAYEIPVTPWDTRIGVHGRESNNRVVEEDVAPLDIRVSSATVGFSVRHPLIRTPETRFELGLIGEWRTARTTSAIDDIVGQPFDFPGSGTQGGIATVAVLRFIGEWTYRDGTQVLSARSGLSWGIDALGATTNGGNLPDGRYLAWLGQFQWARRLELGRIDPVAVFRTDVQLSTDPLLAFERISIGGHASVRGYRENQLVRDQGVISSLELRFPLWRQLGGSAAFDLGPFVDFGWGGNRGRPTPSPETIGSVGLAARWTPAEWLRADLSWGYAIRDVDTSGSIQDLGIYFQLTAFVF